MIERDGYDGPITFCCDECGELDDTRCADFASALAKARSHGWRVRKAGDEWQHFCADCTP